MDFLDCLVLKGWRLFVSLKFGISLLSLIGILSIYGTMAYSSNGALGDNGISMGRTLFFESRWFVALLLLFAINLILSTWHVTKMSCGIWWKKDFRRGRIYYEHGKGPRAEIAVPGGLDETEGLLRRRFTRVHRKDDMLFAHRGLLSRMGPTIVHLGIIIVIFSQIAKAVLIWTGYSVTEGRFVAEEGAPAINFISQPIDTAQQMTDLNRHDIAVPYWIRVLDFDEVKHPNSNMPAHFRSLVEVRDPKTQEVTVAQLDMNHSLKLGGLQFHQAGYFQSSEDGMQRVNFDVRDAELDERIDVTDASPGTRVRVGETEYFLEVDGAAPGDEWRLYSAVSPEETIAVGKLSSAREAEFGFRLLEFFPDFRIDDTTKEPVNVSNDPNNPALRVGVLLEGEQIGTTWVFGDERLAEMVPAAHPQFTLKFQDIRVHREADMQDVDWTNPGQALFVISVVDSASGREIGREMLAAGETSRNYPYQSKSAGAGEKLGTERGFDVRVLGPTPRFATVLSVVREPTVTWTMAGVITMVLGAGLTFMFRYRAFYGWWDAKTETLRMALVPRWGQSPVQEEFDSLVVALSHGAGPVKRGGNDDPREELPPAHKTVNRELVTGS